jgi:NAD(P)-dependent dehydrogenase (short-subunit alcohol dehydrogenase family)
MSTILITGASSGIGKAVATVFADKGWNVVATMRNPAAGADLATRENVLVTRLDVQDADSIAAAIAAGIERFGGIDILFNNAGYNASGVFEQIPAETVRDIFEVNLFGVIDATRAILPHFRARKSGVIVNVSSAVGLVTLPLSSLYNATKFALEGFSESLSYELLAQNIVVKLIEPGLVQTNLAAGWLEQFTAPTTIPDYQEYVSGMVRTFSGLVEGDVPDAATVAETIFEAATDGTTRLRYIVTEGAEQMTRARYDLPEEEYIALMRSTFQPK